MRTGFRVEATGRADARRALGKGYFTEHQLRLYFRFATTWVGRRRSQGEEDQLEKRRALEVRLRKLEDMKRTSRFQILVLFKYP